MTTEQTVIKSVQLLNIPEYYQGTHDSLCAYYTGAMMLASFYPYMSVNYGNAQFKGQNYKILDPIISNYVGDYSKGQASSKEQKRRNILARWFYGGENLDAVTNALNKAVNDSPFCTQFKFYRKNVVLGTFDIIKQSIDHGLPVAIGWDAQDLGCHAVLVTGYWYGTADKWLLINDPGGSSNEVSWPMLKRLSKTRLDVTICSKHKGPRPDKLVQAKDNKIIENFKITTRISVDGKL